MNRGQLMQEWVQLADDIHGYRTVNMYGAHVSLSTLWNINLMQQLAEQTSDGEVIQMLLYRWLLNHDRQRILITMKNHQTALQSPEEVQKYLRMELHHPCPQWYQKGVNQCIILQLHLQVLLQLFWEMKDSLMVLHGNQHGLPIVIKWPSIQ